MAFDETLARRVREALAGEATLEEIKMFGRLCFKINGNMACGVKDDDLVVKCAPERYDGLLAKPSAKEFDFRPMRGILMVEPAGVKTA
jgi:hypothetical protein